MKKSFPTIEVQILHLTAKGNGVGLYNAPSGNQWTVEVPFAIPGDLVRARIYKKRSGIHYSFLEEVIEPSKSRKKPRCIHFGVCGGCRWQQMSYADQLMWKESYIRTCFGEMLNEVQLGSIIPSDKEWEYRNKMEFSFSQNAKGERFLGLMMDSSRGRVMTITDCQLVRQWFMTALEAVRKWWHDSGLQAFHPYKDSGSLRVLTVREGMRTQDKLVMLTVSGNPDYALEKTHITSFVQAVKEAIETNFPAEGKLSIFLRIQQACKGKETNFFEMHLYGPDHYSEKMHVQSAPEEDAERLTFHISPSAFFQPNSSQAEKFYSLAIQMAGANKNSVVYDLYCGTGTIGLSIARHVKEVVGIEVSPESALDARTNASLNGIKNYSVLCGDVRHVLKSVFDDKLVSPPDILIIDPPRAGLDARALLHVLAFQVPKIVYISCNPKTQAADAEKIIAAGYVLKAIQPVDQFPHTVHIENIIILERK